jgi:hypothetical protein
VQAVMAPAGAPLPVGAPVPPPPMGTRAKSGGKGLIVGLAALGAVLLVAIVVVAARSIKPDVSEDQPLTNPFTSAEAVATIAPQIEPETTAPVAPEPELPTATAERTPAPKTTAGGSKKPATTTAPTGQKAPPSGAACDACVSAAQSGNIQGAAANFNRCDDAAKKSACKSQVTRNAPSAAQRAAFNGKCDQAKAIVAAAQAMGAGSGSLTQAVATCK